MTCEACGSQNEAGRKFCGECGAALSLGCPSCGAANAASAKFCGECGTSLLGPVAGETARHDHPWPILFRQPILLVRVGIHALHRDQAAPGRRRVAAAPDAHSKRPRRPRPQHRATGRQRRTRQAPGGAAGGAPERARLLRVAGVHDGDRLESETRPRGVPPQAFEGPRGERGRAVAHDHGGDHGHEVFSA